MTTPAPARPRGIEFILIVVSAVVLPLGLAVILLGWYGASHTPYLFEQVPYLISGGIFGLGLVFLGGLVYFSSLLSRSAAQQQAQGEVLTALLEQIRDGLATPRSAAAPARATNGKAPFVATAKGAMLHRPDCPVVLGREDLRAVAGDDQRFSPCSMCAPLDVDALAN